MSRVVSVVIPLEIPQDEKVLVTRILFQNGDLVTANSCVLEVETSKSSYEIVSPDLGVINYLTNVGDLTYSGTVVATITLD